MKRPRSKAKTVSVIYENNGVRVEYVNRKETDIPAEYQRVKEAVLAANLIVNRYRVRRVRHIILDVCRFQLANSLRELPPETPVEVLASEIARLSFLMQETLTGINRLCHSRIAFLEELRFKLTYGQSPKKRDVDNQILDKEEEESNVEGASA
jgi:hypothetical protein